MELMDKKVGTVRNAMQYAEKLGDGGEEIAGAIIAAFCAGHAAGKASAEKKEKPAAEAESDKKEG